MNSTNIDRFQELKTIVAEDLSRGEKIKKIKKIFGVEEEKRHLYVLTKYQHIDTLVPSKNIDIDDECRCCNITKIDIEDCDFEDPDYLTATYDIPVLVTRNNNTVTIHLIDGKTNTVSDVYFVVDGALESMDTEAMFLFLEQQIKEGCLSE